MHFTIRKYDTAEYLLNSPSGVARIFPGGGGKATGGLGFS